MRAFALLLIRLYQRHVPPYKGFSCAYRCHTGRVGCSQLGYRAIRRFGVIGGVRVLRRRTYLCGVTSRRFAPHGTQQGVSPIRTPFARAFHFQRGFCDGGCDVPCDFSCDLPNFNGCSAGDALNGCGSCDFWGGSKDREEKKKQEQYVYIPPDTRT